MFIVTLLSPKKASKLLFRIKNLYTVQNTNVKDEWNQL